jgi:hypothetical protein
MGVGLPAAYQYYIQYGSHSLAVGPSSNNFRHELELLAIAVVCCERHHYSNCLSSLHKPKATSSIPFMQDALVGIKWFESYHLFSLKEEVSYQ